MSRSKAWRLGPAARAPIARLLRRLERGRAGRCAYELSVCAIFRDEACFLDEWIRFHRGVGVEHFYLYNNFSSDAYEAVLGPWVERGVVTLTQWPRPVGQLSAYRHCVTHRRRESRWIAFIDVDEFLFSPQTTDVSRLLRDYETRPGVCVWQRFFGSGGHDERPAGPVTLSYFTRAGDDVTTVKTIANPRLVYKVGVHVFKFWGGEALDTAGRDVISTPAPTFDRLRINHYWSRSLSDLRTKIARGDASTPKPRDPEWHFAFEAGLNAVRDETIAPLAASLLD
jgi:hypothetical protein